MRVALRFLPLCLLAYLSPMRLPLPGQVTTWACALTLCPSTTNSIPHMPLNTKQLQARSRAAYAMLKPSSIDLCSLSFLASVHSCPNPRLVIATRKPASPVHGSIDDTGSLARRVASYRHYANEAARKPMSALASDLFALARPMVRPSDFTGAYASIECAPMVGRNLSAQA